MGRRDIDSLRLSQRSNGLAFSHHHFLASSASPTRPAKRLHTTILSQIDGNGPARPRERLSLTLTVPEHELKGEVARVGQNIRSLIPPDAVTKRSRTEPNGTVILRARRRKSSASVSTKSITSSILSRRRRLGPKPSLATMPAEILAIIFEDLCQDDLHTLMLTNSNLTEVAASYMYVKPLFASTYRYAQFAHTVAHRKHYADMVRHLDLSPFGAIQDILEADREPLAGWREWKFRNHELYRAARETQGRRHGGKGLSNPRSHPYPSPFLKAWSLYRDIPIGSLCHALQACQRLNKLDISRLHLSNDFIVLHPDHPPTTWTSIIYVSDIPKAWTWKSQELRSISNVYIVDQLRKLPSLETVIASNLASLSTVMVQELVEYSPSLKMVDFRGSGMRRDLLWAVEGTRDEVKKILKDMEKEGRVA